jgi:hypothetical protein
LAGRVGEWTFVYDDSGFTFEDAAEAASADGRTGATSVFSINGNAGLTYAVDGKQVAWVDGRRRRSRLGGGTSPYAAELRAAFEAAGTVEEEGIEPGEADSTIAMRAVCALAGLPLTLSALRQVPLVVLPFG